MIRNERQYRITKAQVEEFDRKLLALSKAAPPNVHPRLVQAQHDAMRSQIDELREELAAYEALQSGRAKVLELTSLDELPAALIQARISVGLTQRELAERLGMKEQQLQRYEATEYAGASLERIREIISALGVKVREDIFLPGADVTPARVVRRARSAGLTKEFIASRILPAKRAVAANDDATALGAASLLNRIFGWSPAMLFGDAPLTLPGAALAGARFKLPANATTRATDAYATYAHYVAGLLLRATPTLTASPIPIDATEVRAAISARGEISFSTALDYVWSLGVPVLPLSDPGAFHGSTWRIAGRNVIVLKQATRLESRWLHDILHELRHAAEDPDAENLSFIDYDKLGKENASSAPETTASVFAGDVTLDGRAEELAEQCATEASGSIERLKAVVPRVAQREGVPVAALANYMAFRLSYQGAPSWWGAATNLQTGSTDPWLTARDRALSHLDLTMLDDTERTVLVRALEGGAS
jgi:transcriptional regulator with XRE-family HTH domain